MTGRRSGSATLPPLIVRRAPWLLVAVHAPFVVGPVLATSTGLVFDPGDPLAAVLAGVALGALQLRLSFAAAAGRRPTGWRWNYLLLLAAIYVPIWFFTWNWAITQVFAIVSASLLLRRRLVVVVATLSVVGTSIAASVVVATIDHGSVAQIVLAALLWVLTLPASGAAVYGAIRLVRVSAELYSTRAELAELAVGRERVRVSRDLHDLLGQSLSAVSLKGDLAIKLLPRDRERARAELASLTELARSALRDARAVARDEHSVSLRAEIDAAGALLSAAGIQTSVDVDLPRLAKPMQDVLAWAVREGATNVLRHSEATTCLLRVARAGGLVRLEIANDGVRDSAGTGTGIGGVVERARTVSGTATAAVGGDGWFRLTVDVPEVPA